MNKNVLVTVLLLSIVHSSIWAEEPLSLATGEWSPFVSASLPDNGPFAILVSRVFEIAGLPATIRFFPWLRVESKVTSGEYFAGFPYALTAERRKSYLVSENMLLSSPPPKYLSFHSDLSNLRSNKEITVELLKTFRVGILRGSGMISILRASGITDLTEVNDTSQLLGMLKENRIDIVVEAKGVIEALLSGAFATDSAKFYYWKGSPLEPPSGMGLIVSRKYPNAQVLLDRFNQALLKYQATPEYKLWLKGATKK